MKTIRLIRSLVGLMVLSIISINIFAQANPSGTGLSGTTNDGVNPSTTSGGSGSSSSSGSTGSSSSGSGSSSNSSSVSVSGKNKGAQNFNGGNGAPIDGGVSILILATAGYTSSKLVKMNQKKKGRK